MAEATPYLPFLKKVENSDYYLASCSFGRCSCVYVTGVKSSKIDFKKSELIKKVFELIKVFRIDQESLQIWLRIDRKSQKKELEQELIIKKSLSQ